VWDMNTPSSCPFCRTVLPHGKTYRLPTRLASPADGTPHHTYRAFLPLFLRDAAQHLNVDGASVNMDKPDLHARAHLLPRMSVKIHAAPPRTHARTHTRARALRDANLKVQSCLRHQVVAEQHATRRRAYPTYLTSPPPAVPPVSVNPLQQNAIHSTLSSLTFFIKQDGSPSAALRTYLPHAHTGAFGVAFVPVSRNTLGQAFHRTKFVLLLHFLDVPNLDIQDGFCCPFSNTHPHLTYNAGRGQHACRDVRAPHRHPAR